MKRISRYFAVAACVLLAAPAFAQDAASAWPQKPITMVVPFPAGNNTDVIARILAERMSQKLGQPFVIDNRPGASGAVGLNIVAKAQPDGYTIGIGSTSNLAISASLNANLPFNAETDFAPIGLLGNGPYVIAVNPKLEANTLPELIDLAKKMDGKLAYGTTGEATFSNLMTLNLASVSGVKMTHVPYKAAGEASLDVMAGRIHMQFSTVGSMVGFIRDGQLKGIAVASSKRLPEMPDVPTFTEAGVNGFEAGIWYAFVAPAGTPKPIIDRLNTEMNASLAEEAVIDALYKAGVAAESSTPEELGELVKSDIVRWQKVAQDAGIKGE